MGPDTGPHLRCRGAIDLEKPMVLEALRGYILLVNGLTEATRQRALVVAKQLLEQGEELIDQAMASASSIAPDGPTAVGRQASALAEELLATSRTNRDLLIGVIRSEVDHAVERLGLSDRDEVAALNRVVERLQRQLDAAITFGATTATNARSAASARRPGGPAGSRPGSKSAAAGARTTPAKAAKKAGASKAAKKASSAHTATGSPPRKAAARKTAAKKAAPGGPGGPVGGTAPERPGSMPPQAPPAPRPTTTPPEQADGPARPGDHDGDR